MDLQPYFVPGAIAVMLAFIVVLGGVALFARDRK
jgi:hypothetical protein